MMKPESKFLKLILLIVFVSTFNSFAVAGAAPKWYSKLRQIKLMETTRQEIEKLFDNPRVIDTSDGWSGRGVEYRLKEGELDVTYSLGKCVGKTEYVYDVEKDVITDLHLNLKKFVNISALSLDLRNFEKTEIYDIRGVFEYRNEDTGEQYMTSEYFRDGSIQIRSLEIFPSARQESLACKNIQKERADSR
jgi:hypothetical protein